MKHRIGNRLILALVGVSLCLGTGCAIGIGNRGQDASSPPTLGRELIDLKEAREAGLISPAEYEQQRARLLGNGRSH